jgi:hypothetical protein
MSVAIPLITAVLPYIAPPIAAGIGYVVGWFHHKHKVSAATKPQ